MERVIGVATVVTIGMEIPVSVIHKHAVLVNIPMEALVKTVLQHHQTVITQLPGHADGHVMQIIILLAVYVCQILKTAA
jgi:hypothetical protein